jgi:hypothetical protein
MTDAVVIDPREITITPVFKYVEVENIPKSEKAGHPVMEVKEMVEVRFAGQKNYSPMFPVDAFWRREGNRTITYAERWAEQYAAFKQGDEQQARGTPLEMLRPYDITPELISLCRALKIYSVEALYHLEGQAVKSLGMNANKLKDAARKFMASNQSNEAAMTEIEALKAKIAELEAKSTAVPEEEPAPEEVEEMVQEADDAYAGISDDQLKEQISEFTGSKPRGNPSRETLIRSLEELKAA